MVDRDLLVQAVIGGLYEILYSQIIDGRIERLPGLLPELTYCALVHYLGPAAALAACEAVRLAGASDQAVEAAAPRPIA